MQIKFLGLPLIKLHKTAEKDYRSLKLVLFGLFVMGIGAGKDRGDHLHFGFGISKFEIFIGLSIKEKWVS